MPWARFADSLTLRRKFLLVGAVALIGVLGTAALALRLTVRAPLGNASVDRILEITEVARELLESWDDPNHADTAYRLSGLLGYRVTIVAPDGTVLGETAIPTSDPTTLENHADRPEIRQALAGERAVVERRSASLGEELVYAAVLADVAGRSVVVRLSTPADPESTAILRAFWLLAGAGLLGFVLLWLGGYALESRFHAPVESLAREVRSMSEGKVGAGPSRSDYPAELGEVVGALRDLAEELQGRVAALRRQRDEMQTLIDSIAEGVVALTEDARVLRMNPAAASLLDIAPPPPFAPIGTLIRHPDLRDHLEESVILPLPAREFRLGDRHLLVSSRLLGGGGAVVTLSDVTELRRIEQVRRDFVANASHELKTPLTAVRGFAETLLEEETRDGVGRNFLTAIRDNTLRLQHLVDDLLDLSRLESGSWSPNEEEIDLAEAAEAGWSELAAENRHRSVEFVVEGQAVVLADGQALHQIFRNLFENAVRYTPDGGRVRVTISPEGPLVETAVSDTGSGIPSSSLPRIFERFYRGDAGRDRAAGGTGLGLAIVRHLVQSMGGRVVAESQLGHGTTIRFSLPRVEVATPTS